MASPFLTFQKFNDPGLATAIAEKLQEQNIDYRLENESPNFDPSYAFASVEPTIHLKVLSTDFTRAHATLESYYKDQLKDVDPGYYLFSFTNEELLDIVAKPDEWGHFDYVLASQLLAERGHAITSATAGQLKAQRIQELAQPDTTSPFLIYAGYICGIFGGIFGLLIGYILAYVKKTLPNGENVYMFSPAKRGHGKIILLISAISLPIWVFMKLYKNS